MKFSIATAVALSSCALAAPSVKRQSCAAPSNPTCAELVSRCVAQGTSWHADPFNNRVCVAAMTCYGVGAVWDAASCNTRSAPAHPNTFAGLSQSLRNTINGGNGIVSQQNYVDFLYGSVQNAWPAVSTVNVWWSSISGWTAFPSGNIPINNFNDWLKFSSAPSSAPPTTPPASSCIAPADASCLDIVRNCVNGFPANDPWSKKSCVAAASCWGVGNVFYYARCTQNVNLPAVSAVPQLSRNVFNGITNNAASISAQSYIDLVFGSITTGPWPANGAAVVSNWFAPIRSWTGFSGDIPFQNFADWLRWSSTEPSTPTNPPTTPPPTNPPTNPPTSGPIWGAQTRCKHDVSMSYDDGPYVWHQNIDNFYTNAGFKTTYFINGNNWGCIYNEDNVRMLRHAYEAGHVIASHTWSHARITDISIDELRVEVDRLEEALWKILGVRPALIRPPYGAFNQAAVDYLNGRGYTVVTWDIDTGDSGGQSSAQTMSWLPGQIRDGSMILGHETYDGTSNVLTPQIISLARDRGLRLVSVDQCLDVSPYKAVGSYGQRDGSWVC